MLILSRKENQKIRIGNNIVLNVISISDNIVKIGIEADKDVKIYRDEIYESVTQHTKLAANKLNEKIPVDIKNLKLNKITKNDKN